MRLNCYFFRLLTWHHSFLYLFLYILLSTTCMLNLLWRWWYWLIVCWVWIVVVWMKFSVVFSSSRRRQPLKTKQTKVIVSMLDYPFTLAGAINKRWEGFYHIISHNENTRTHASSQTLTSVINFLSVLPRVEGDNSLSEYMKVTFGREVSYLTEGIKLKHVRDVWLLIKYTQADLLMRKRQVNMSLVDILG